MTSIVVRTQFEGFHYWDKAPDPVLFLRSVHRHMFHVELKIQVFHDDRDLEFILVRRALDAHLAARAQITPNSCEDICHQIIAWAHEKYGKGRKYSCAVFEDGENGAVVE